MPVKPTITNLSINMQEQIESIQQLHKNSVIYHINLNAKRVIDRQAKITKFEQEKNKNKAYKDSCIALRNDVTRNYHKYYMSYNQFRTINNPDITNVNKFSLLRDIYNRFYIYRNWRIKLDETEILKFQAWYELQGKTEQDEDQFSSIWGHPKPKDGSYGIEYQTNIYKDIDIYITLFYPKSEVVEQPITGRTNRTTYKSAIGNQTETLASITQIYVPVFSFDENTYITQYNNMKIIENTLPYYVNRYQENVIHDIDHLNLSQEFKTKLVNTMNILSCQTYIKQNKDIEKKAFNVNLKNKLHQISVYQKSNFNEIKTVHDTLSTYVHNTYLTSNIVEVFKTTIETVYKENAKAYPAVNVVGKYVREGYTLSGFVELKEGFTYDSYFTNQ